MTTEVFKPDSEVLPDHMAIGLRDETTQIIDGYVVAAAERIDEAIVERIDDIGDVEELEAIATEMILDEVVERLSEALDDEEAVDAEEMRRHLRRRQIMAEQEHKRRFARPILSYASIVYPPKRY